LTPWQPDCSLSMKHGTVRECADMENSEITKIVGERRAAVVLGLSLPELRWFSRQLDLGHWQPTGEGAQTVFTYEELKILSMAAFTSEK
jgi:hypothetical protein